MSRKGSRCHPKTVTIGVDLRSMPLYSATVVSARVPLAPRPTPAGAGCVGHAERAMRQLVTSFLIVICVSSSALAFQARSGGSAAARPTIRACAILTRDMVLPFAANPKVLDLIPPEEEALGTYGVACEYGVVR